MRYILAVTPSLLLCGCMTLHPRTDEAPQSAASPETRTDADAATTAKGEKELPPALGAKACLKTAEELEKRGFEIDAIAEYERARQLDSKHARVAARLAVLYGRNGDEVRAAAEYETALKLSPNDADLLNDLGCFQSNRGDWPAAEKALNRALQVKPDHSRAWSNLAVVYAKSGRMDESRKAFGRLLPPAQVEYNLGVIQAGLGHAEEAKSCFRAALAHDPQFTQAHNALSNLEAPPGGTAAAAR
jgi:Tfp pilus assembly protein PilF